MASTTEPPAWMVKGTRGALWKVKAVEVPGARASEVTVLGSAQSAWRMSADGKVRHPSGALPRSSGDGETHRQSLSTVAVRDSARAAWTQRVRVPAARPITEPALTVIGRSRLSPG